MKKIYLGILFLLFSITTLLFSCGSSVEDDPQTQPTAINNINVNGEVFGLNHKIAVVTPYHAMASFSKNGALSSYPQGNGCVIEVAPSTSEENLLHVVFQNANFQPNISTGTYLPKPSDPMNIPAKNYTIVITKGQNITYQASGELFLTKTVSSLNIKGTVVLKNGEVLKFPTEGIDIAIQDC